MQDGTTSASARAPQHSGHLPSTKKIIVHGIDSALPPQQFMVLEDTQFKGLMEESLKDFNITESSDQFQLADAKTSKSLRHV